MNGPLHRWTVGLSPERLIFASWGALVSHWMHLMPLFCNSSETHLCLGGISRGRPIWGVVWFSSCQALLDYSSLAFLFCLSRGHYLMWVHFAVHEQCATSISNKQGCFLVFVSGTKCLVVLMETTHQNCISFFTSLPTQTIIRKIRCMLSDMRGIPFNQ